MTQSANARPCNCDQALRAEDILNRVRRIVGNYDQCSGAELRAVLGSPPNMVKRQADPVKECANCGCVTYGHQMLCCETPLECGHRQRVEYWREACQKAEGDIATIGRILCDLVSAPSLSVAQFADPTLERIRLAMLGRER